MAEQSWIICAGHIGASPPRRDFSRARRSHLLTVKCSPASGLSLAVLFACLLLLPGCERRGSESAVKTITVWYPFGGEDGQAMHEIIARFERSHPDIHVKLSFSANSNSSNQKLFLAIAGGTPPDVTFVGGQQVTEWSSRGALADITDQARQAGLGPDDYWLPSWRECNFNGRTHALPWGSDPNFAFVWNKKMFREAGLDPERPPRTIEELDEFNHRLTKIDAQGQIQSVGLIPWEFGGDTSMFTWGYAFGGDFYVPPPAESMDMVGRITANDPRNVAALRWLQSYAKLYDVRKISAFNSNFVGVANNPFYLGKEGMCLMYIGWVRLLRRYAPTLECGVSYLPAPPDGEHPTGWIGGWALAIPRGAPASPEAFEFMRWMSATPEGTLGMSELMGQFSAYRKNPYYDRIKNDPILSVFYQIVSHARHTRTLMPAVGYLSELLIRGVDDAIYGGRDAQTVLDDVTVKAQLRLEEVMKRAVQREKHSSEHFEDSAASPRS